MSKNPRKTIDPIDEPYTPAPGEIRWQDFRDDPPAPGGPAASGDAGRVAPARVNKRAVKRQATSAVAFEGAEPEPGDPLLAFAPVPHKQLRRNSIGPARQRAFIAHLAATGIVTQAARHIGASMEALYKLKKWQGAEEFAAAWEEALDRGVDRLEDCALARAIEGEERMVVSAGKLVGVERRHNEALVMFFLKNRRPARYGAELRPGHPVYERIRAEVLAAQQDEYGESEEEILASIDAKLERMRKGETLARALLAEDGGMVGLDLPELPGGPEARD